MLKEIKEIEEIVKTIKITERNKELKPNKKTKAKLNKNLSKEKSMGITLIALIVTILFFYDEKIKCSNSKGFLLQTI